MITNWKWPTIENTAAVFSKIAERDNKANDDQINHREIMGTMGSGSPFNYLGIFYSHGT